MIVITQNNLKDQGKSNPKNQDRLAGSDCVPGFKSKGADLISCPFSVVHFGFDTLDINYFVDFERTQDLFEKLKLTKLSLQSTNDQEVNINLVSNQHQTEYALQRYGTKIFSFVLKKGDITFSLSNRPSTSGIPNVNLKIGSISSASYKQVKTDFEKLLLALGCTIKEEKLSRIDICKDLSCDITTLDIQCLEKHISKARSASIYYQYKTLTGIQVGKGNVVLRIYDKIAEMTQKNDENKKNHFQEIWKNQENVTRIEYQLRREFLNDYNINTLEQLEQKINEIWLYLTESWFRHTQKPVDRINKNQTDSKISNFWKQVQKNSGKILNILKKRIKKNICNVKSLVNQATGCLVSICGSLGMTPDSKQQIYETMSNLIKEGLNENYENFSKFSKKLNTKRARLINF